MNSKSLLLTVAFLLCTPCAQAMHYRTEEPPAEAEEKLIKMIYLRFSRIEQPIDAFLLSLKKRKDGFQAIQISEDPSRYLVFIVWLAKPTTFSEIYSTYSKEARDERGIESISISSIILSHVAPPVPKKEQTNGQQVDWFPLEMQRDVILMEKSLRLQQLQQEVQQRIEEGRRLEQELQELQQQEQELQRQQQQLQNGWQQQQQQNFFN